MADGEFWRLIEEASSARTHFERTRDAEALERALKFGRKAVSLKGLPLDDRLQALRQLAVNLASLFAATRSVAALDEARALLGEAESLLSAGNADPATHPQLPKLLTNICAVHAQRYQQLGELDDLEAAIAAGRRGLQLSQMGSESQAFQLSNLGGLLRSWWQATGERSALEDSIRYGSAVEQAADSSFAQRAMMIATLAGSLLERFRLDGEDADLDSAINAARRAADAATMIAEKVSSEVLLAGGLQMRYQLRGDMRDLGAAVELHRSTLAQVDEGYPEYGMLQSGLAVCLRARYERLRSMSDLDAALQASREAVRTAGAQFRGQCVLELALNLRFAARRCASAGHDNEALVSLNEALALLRVSIDTPAGHSMTLADDLTALGNLLVTRYELAGDPEDWRHALAAHERALEHAQVADQQAVVALINIGMCLLEAPDTERGRSAERAAGLFEQARGRSVPGSTVWAQATLNLIGSIARSPPKQLDRAAALEKELYAHPLISPRLRAMGAMSIAQLLAEQDIDQAAQRYAAAVGLITQAAWQGADAGSRQANLLSFQGLARDAAATEIARNNPARALELLEQGRSVLWAQKLNFQADDGALRAADPQLAQRLRDIAAALEHQFTPDSDPRAIDRRLALTDEWDELVRRARQLDGMEGFLEAPNADTLVRAAADGPLIIVNISRWRCDLLVLQDDTVRAVPLSVTASEVDVQVKAYLRAMRGLGPRSNLDAALVDVLGWLWNRIAQPALAEIGAVAEPSALPRIWWCPTGPLTLLPLHAAGRHNRSRESVMDHVVSSYTPTIRALLAAREKTALNGRHACEPGLARMLLVAVDDAPDWPKLSLAAERDAVRARFSGNLTLLQSDGAMHASVLRALADHRWVHFACHGDQNLAQPAEGGLILHDDVLSVATVGDTRLSGDFAYLSACKTATGGMALDDEAVTLAAALLCAGYSQIIGTLWLVPNDVAAEVAEHVYDPLLRDGTFAYRDAPFALHAAVDAQRHSGRTLRDWASFIHVGI